MIENGYFENKLLKKKLQMADENPFLNYDALVEACDHLFGKKKSLPYNEFLEKTKDAYQIEMEQYAKVHNFTDTVKLAEFFSYVKNNIEQNISSQRRTDKIIIIGCGQGRLADVYVSMAKKYGIKEITFNDLIESHVQQTEQKIKDIYGTNGSLADGIKVNYLPGDFLALDVSEMFDAAFMIWYVSSEFCNPNSSEEMVNTRHKVYSKIQNILVPGGGLVEDIPDPNMSPGFYEIANFKTAHILQQRGILMGQNHNLLLSNWTSEQTKGTPYQLRYTARNGSDVREKEKAGFFLRKTEQAPIPESSLYDKDVALKTIRDTENIWEAIKLLNQIALQTVKFPDGDRVDQKRRKITLWEKA